jgi:hypothetical protein
MTGRQRWMIRGAAIALILGFWGAVAWWLL